MSKAISLQSQLDYINTAIAKMDRDPGWAKGMTEEKVRERRETLHAIHATVERALILEQVSIEAMEMFERRTA